MDLSVTPVAQFGTLATHGTALDGRRHGEDTPGGHRQQTVQRVQASQAHAQQLAGHLAAQAPQAGQFRPVESGKNPPKSRNNGQQTQADIAQAAANARQQATDSATRAAATRYVLQAASFTPGAQAGNATTGYLVGSNAEGRPSPQALSHASDTYSFMARQGVMTKALAPWGTGISFQV